MFCGFPTVNNPKCHPCVDYGKHLQRGGVRAAEETAKTVAVTFTKKGQLFDRVINKILLVIHDQLGRREEAGIACSCNSINNARCF